jgi:hypothetical protein
MLLLAACLRDHHATFIETGEDGLKSGHLFHVNGDIHNGMSFEHKITKEERKSASSSNKGDLSKIVRGRHKHMIGFLNLYMRTGSNQMIPYERKDKMLIGGRRNLGGNGLG